MSKDPSHKPEELHRLLAESIAAMKTMQLVEESLPQRWTACGGNHLRLVVVVVVENI